MPVATAEATIAGGSVGLYNISTRPTCRGRGIGSVMTWRPLHDALAHGCDLGVLQAAPDVSGLAHVVLPGGVGVDGIEDVPHDSYRRQVSARVHPRDPRDGSPFRE